MRFSTVASSYEIRSSCLRTLLLFLTLLCCDAERSYEELPLSSELCAELGYGADFDVCGVIEFCTGNNNHQRRNLRRHKSDHDFHGEKKKIISCNSGDAKKSKAKAHKRSKYYYSHKSGKQNYSITNEDDHVVSTTDSTAMKMEGMENMDGKDMPEDEDAMTNNTSTDKMVYAPKTKAGNKLDHSTIISSNSVEGEADWSATNSDVFSEEVTEEKQKFQRSHSNSSADANFDLESWLASHLPVTSLTDPINTAEFGWRLPGSSHCSWPGPLIRLKPGQRHGLLVKGASGTKTNMHFHGLHIAGHGNSENMMRVVEGNDVLVYALDIPENHMGGTHWYHSNWQGETQTQVGGGAFGMLIVDDGANIGTTDANVLDFMKREHVLVVDNRKSNRWLANGMEISQEHFQFRFNEWYRLRILAVNTDAYTVGETIHFGEACRVHAMAHDGILRFQVPETTPRSDFIVSTASRLDVAIRCTGSSTISIGNQQVASIQVQDPNVKDVHHPATPFESGNQAWKSTRPPYLADLRGMNVDNRWKLHLDEVNINHQSWFEKHPLCDDKGNDFVYDSVQEWSITGLESHPLHVHTYPMQVVSEEGCGSGHIVGEYYDTLSAHGSTEVSQNCKVRLRLTDMAGPTVIQSQTLQHVDQGSIGILHVVGGPDQAEEPHVFRCSNPESCDEPESIITCSEW